MLSDGLEFVSLAAWFWYEPARATFIGLFLGLLIPFALTEQPNAGQV